jgi:hypothetical protein
MAWWWWYHMYVVVVVGWFAVVHIVHCLAINGGGCGGCWLWKHSELHVLPVWLVVAQQQNHRYLFVQFF